MDTVGFRPKSLQSSLVLIFPTSRLGVGGFEDVAKQDPRILTSWPFHGEAQIYQI
jgi:hypothetical protein